MSLNSIYYSEDINSIDKIEFCIYTNKDIKKYSVVSSDPFGINLAESYESYEPKKGGLVDLRLGTSDIYLPCLTCGLNSIECPGHFGHTELVLPVFHFGFLNHLKNILQTICLKCSKILVEKPEKIKNNNKKPENRYKEIKNLTKHANYCFHCGVPVPKIKKEIKDNGSIKIIIEREIMVTPEQNDESQFKKTLRESLSPLNCYNILKNISDNDALLLGFNIKLFRPEDLIIKNFPIPPVIIRPTSRIDFMSSGTLEDSLTLKISDIILKNKYLRRQLEKETLNNELSIYTQDTLSLLQLHTAIYFDNESSNLPRSEFKAGGRLTKSISERIKGKAGRVRCNLMGKRVDFSARSIITSDPYINIDQVGIPKKIAMELTIPEEVTPQNIKFLLELVKNGRDIYPGANFILRTNYRDGKLEVQKIDLKYRKKEIKLNIGDVVERHCVNNDYVLFNRQPTLHKPSMMGHKIQVLDNDKLFTFRMNVSVCQPYNADFDGDEMNIHLAQSVQTRNELKRIASVQYQIVSVKNSKPIIGCQQDALSGSYMLSTLNKKLKGWEIANMLCNTSTKLKYNIDLSKEYSGNEVFSFIIPEDINIDQKNIEVINGNIVRGYLSKKALGSEGNSIIHFIWDKYGPSKTRNFIDDSQKLILNFLLYNGQTCGFKDVYIDQNINNKIEQYISNKILESKYNITQFENDIEQLPLDIIENSLSSELNIVQGNIGQMLENYFDNNNFFKIASSNYSGAKGSTINIAQMSGVLGQQSVEGERIKKKIEGRTLIYFHKDDDTPEGRGFVKSSFLKGLRGFEFFYNSMGGREGAIDTAIKTALTGYISRQLIKGLEDLIIRYDGTNRNSKGIIVQLIYGENGINQSNQSNININILEMNNEKLLEKLCFNNEEIKILEKNLKISNKQLTNYNNNYLLKLKNLRDQLRLIHMKATLNFTQLNDIFMMPINLFRITQDFKNKSINNKIIDLEPEFIENKIDELLNDYDIRLITSIKPNDKFLKQSDRQLKFLLEIALYEYLSPKKCIFVYKLNKKLFLELINDIKINFIKSIVEPGEMIGILAAQSLGEPTSQMTLNTKHFAGVAGRSSANMGVPRIQELLHYSKSIKTPQMTIYFKSPYKSDRSTLNKVISYFKHLNIRQLISSAEIYYDINDKKLSQILIDDNVSNPFYVNNQKTDIYNLPFVFRIKFNIEKLIDKEITLLDIKTKFISHWYKNYNNTKNLKKLEKDIISRISRCAILSTNAINKNQIIHIRFNMISFNYNIITEFLKMILDDITLKGIENINSIEPIEENVMTFNNDTGDIVRNKEYMVITNGINFEKLKLIKGIDFTKTRCNDINTIYRLYGIEATRQILLYEITTTYNMSGVNINHNHLSVLVDQMCHSGDIISMDRHGLLKIENDPISRASFEKTMDHFINAALYNEKDSLKSLSSSIAVGKVIPGGTGAFELLLDTKKIENSEYTENESNGRITYTALEEHPLLQEIIKLKINKHDFFIPI